MRKRFRSLLGFLFRHALARRPLLLLIAYGMVFAASLWGGYLLRFDFIVEPQYQREFIQSLWWMAGIKFVLLFIFGQFGVLLSYFRLPDVYRIAMALGISSLIFVVLWYGFPTWQIPPRGVILGDLLLSVTGVVMFRTALRVVRERVAGNRSRGGENGGRVRRVAIVGAGQTGAALAYDLLSSRRAEVRPLLFLDDDRHKWRHQIHGIPIVDSADNLEFLRTKYGLDGIILAMSNAPARRIQEITDMATSLGMTAEIVPSMGEVAMGRVKVSRIRPVAIEDLLGRESVDLDAAEIQTLIQGRTVMVTGGGGSIGSELCRQISAQAPALLLIVERCEVQLYHVEQEMKEKGFEGSMVGIVADICDEGRMRTLFERYSPELVFHAAAHKHVPIMEHQPGEALKNNSLGTARMIEYAIEFGVERFVFISTDKAINPTNAMGASKRLAEIYLQSRYASGVAAGHKMPNFSAVRFGNVLGSSGSVVPLFRRQIAEGGPVTVTHPEVTRYFMTIPEAVGLVLQCATQARGGEIFVLDMGKPVKIMDLARKMIQLSGYVPGRDIELKIVGLRPGEKLYEELQHADELHEETHHPRIYRFSAKEYDFGEVTAFIDGLKTRLDVGDAVAIKRELKRFIPEYKPHLN